MKEQVYFLSLRVEEFHRSQTLNPLNIYIYFNLKRRTGNCLGIRAEKQSACLSLCEDQGLIPIDRTH